VAIFIGLTELGGLMPLLKKYYPAGTPAAVAYRAGYEGSQSLVRTTVGGLPEVVEKNSEKFLGLIYIGPELK
jgi:precorrin-4 methylase